MGHLPRTAELAAFAIQQLLDTDVGGRPILVKDHGYSTMLRRAAIRFFPAFFRFVRSMKLVWIEISEISVFF